MYIARRITTSIAAAIATLCLITTAPAGATTLMPASTASTSTRAVQAVPLGASSTVAATKPAPGSSLKHCSILRGRRFGGGGWRLERAHCGRHLSDRQIVVRLRQGGWHWRLIPTAFGVVMGESGGWTAAMRITRSSSGRVIYTDWGLMQINDHHWGWLIRSINPFEPVANARAGLHIYRTRGFGQWHASAKASKYRHRANAAIAAVRRGGLR